MCDDVITVYVFNYREYLRQHQQHLLPHGTLFLGNVACVYPFWFPNHRSFCRLSRKCLPRQISVLARSEEPSAVEERFVEARWWCSKSTEKLLIPQEVASLQPSPTPSSSNNGWWRWCPFGHLDNRRIKFPILSHGYFCYFFSLSKSSFHCCTQRRRLTTTNEFMVIWRSKMRRQ